MIDDIIIDESVMKTKKINLGDLIFILFYKFKGEIRGSTTLQKLVDIIRLDSELEVDVNYSPYDYGDFSQQTNDVVQVFIDNSWISKKELLFDENKKINIFKLTRKGEQIAKTLYENLLSRELDYLQIIDRFLDKSRDDIMSFSYFWYPKTTIYSKIKQEIFKKSNILSLLDGELETEYNSIKETGKTIKEFIKESWKC